MKKTCNRNRIAFIMVFIMFVLSMPVTARAQKTGTEFTGTSFRTSDFDNNAAITLNLTADAVLTIDADKTIGGLEIYDGGYTLTVKGTKTLNTARIRMADIGTFSMESGTINASVSAENTLLIEQGSLQIKGGTLRITGKDPESDAAHIAGDVNMSGGILHANAIAAALAVEGNCVLTGGKITAYSAQRDAILVLGSFTIGSEITAEVGIPEDGSPIYADGGLQLTSAVTVKTPAGGKPDAEYGCYIADKTGNWDIPKVEIVRKDSIQGITGSWKKDSKGWYYLYSDGTYPKNTWKEIDYEWYHFDASGYMQDPGWFRDLGKWYWLRPGSGIMMRGWLKVNNQWYFFDRTGGHMRTGWAVDDGEYYYMASDGIMQTGWLQQGGTWYYLRPSGIMMRGWLKLNNAWYYFENSGAMLANTSRSIDGKTYTFNANGVCTNP